MRSAVEVRAAVVDDLPIVAALCVAAREEAASAAQVCPPDVERMRRHLGVLAGLPGGFILVATDGNETIGFALGRVVEPSFYSDLPGLLVETVYVIEAARRRGVGHALLTAVADLAADAGAPDVYALPIPGSRGSQRFLARVGFAPVGGHRHTTTATLQRTLSAELGRSGGRTPGRRRSLEDLIARRRKARTEGLTGPVDLRAFQASLAAGQAERPAGGPPLSDSGPAAEAPAPQMAVRMPDIGAERPDAQPGMLSAESGSSAAPYKPDGRNRP